MAIAQITGPGLRAMALLVALLWGCVFLERSIVRSATRETYRALEAIRALKMKKHAEPVFVPALQQAPAPRRPALG